MKKLLLAISISVISFSAFAGEFAITCYSTNLDPKTCSASISDIITERFTKAYPYAKYQLVEISDASESGVAFASVGITQRPKIDGQVVFPVARVTASGYLKDIKEDQRKPFEIETLRKATQGLMEACDKALDCNIGLK
jgi:hypothetical protein